MKKSVLLLALTGFMTITVFAQDIQNAPKIAPPKNHEKVATVNGRPITKKDLDRFVKLLVTRGATDSPQLRNQVKQEMINRLVLVQEAEKLGIDKLPEVKTEIELARQGVLVRTLMASYLKKNPVTDKQVQDEYNLLKQQQTGKLEYQVRHILVPDEKTATELLTKIKNGKVTFEDAAKKESKDPGSAEKGGELGWAPATHYVANFAQAVTSLKKGQLIDKPVQTQYGWHIIQVQDTRQIKFPPLTQLRPQIEELLRQQSLADYQKELRDKAPIKDLSANSPHKASHNASTLSGIERD